MARIPRQEIDDLKQRLSLVDVATSQGHKLKCQGKDSYVCLCPFHKEKTPSCTITPSKNLFHCFGCGVSGSVLDWLIKTEHLTFLNGLVRLRELGKSQGLLAPSSLTATVPPAPPRQKLADLDDDGQALLRQVVDYYHQNLLNSPEALAWLEKRGLNHPELVSRFKLGYAGDHGINGSAGLLPSTSSNEGNRKPRADALLSVDEVYRKPVGPASDPKSLYALLLRFVAWRRERNWSETTLKVQTHHTYRFILWAS